MEKIPTTPNYVLKNNSKDQIIGDKSIGILTRRKVTMIEEQVKLCLLSKVERKTVIEACKDECWIKAMEEELM